MSANTFHVRETNFADIPAVELRDERSGAFAIIARRGATLLDWQVPHAGEMVALTDGYLSARELTSQHGVRNAILAPFPNRIAHGRYRFGGREYDLLPETPGDHREFYHGFLRNMDLVVADTRESDHDAGVRFSGDLLPDAFAGYPFALKFDVQFTLSARSIALTVTATNIGDRDVPYATGWHPYFRLGDAPIDTLELTIPASHTVVTDAKLLPLPGDAAFEPLQGSALPDFRHGRPVGTELIDRCYCRATPDQDGVIRSHLRDPATGRQLTVWQRGGVTHLYTGDTPERDPRRAIAIEPVEIMTDSFNRPDCAQAILLSPGASRSFACGVEFHVESGDVKID